MLAFVAAEDRYFLEKSRSFSTITRGAATAIRFKFPAEPSRVIMTLLVGQTLTHDEIMNTYAQSIFLGLGCFGVRNASKAYFGKPVEALSVEDLAFLAGLTKSPASFHPIRRYDRALKRRNFILAEMARMNLISDQQQLTAAATALVVRSPLGKCPVP